MNRRRSISAINLLAAAWFVSLLMARLPAACARHVVLLKASVGHGGDVGIAKEPSALADALAARKEGVLLEGRKLGARDMEETEAMGADEADHEKGNADTSRLKKPQGSPMQQQVQGVDAPSAAARRRRPANSLASARRRSARTEEARTAPGKKHRDAVAEMYGMLKRDYAWKARRRSPINNGEPLQEEEP